MTRRIPALLATALLAGAVVSELRKPPRRRRWHGTLLGFVPYDLRRPTWRRVRERLWNRRGPLVGPQVFGVGWSVNLRRLVPGR